jgi:hypothetical protein
MAAVCAVSVFLLMLPDVLGGAVAAQARRSASRKKPTFGHGLKTLLFASKDTIQFCDAVFTMLVVVCFIDSDRHQQTRQSG